MPLLRKRSGTPTLLRAADHVGTPHNDHSQRGGVSAAAAAQGPGGAVEKLAGVPGWTGCGWPIFRTAPRGSSATSPRRQAFLRPVDLAPLPYLVLPAIEPEVAVVEANKAREPEAQGAAGTRWWNRG